MCVGGAIGQKQPKPCACVFAASIAPYFTVFTVFTVTQGEAEQISMPVNAVKPGSEHANDSYNDIPPEHGPWYLGIGILVSKAVVEVMDASALPNSSSLALGRCASHPPSHAGTMLMHAC